MAKVALVTGGTKGIGLAIAEVLIQMGNDVIISGSGITEQREVDRILKNLESKATGVAKVHYIPADLTDVDAVRKMIHDITGFYEDGVDILVNNAGFQHVCAIETFPVDKWDAMLAVHLSAPFHFIQNFLPNMRKKGWGRIVNISSTNGVVAMPQKIAYVTTKHGLNGITKAVAVETAGSGVTCNAVCPGYVLTELLEEQAREKADHMGISYQESLATYSKSIPTRKFTTPKQVADLVAYLCSESAAQMTGSIIMMDAGLTAQ